MLRSSASSHALEHTIGRSLHSLSADKRADRDAPNRRRSSSRSQLAHGEDRSDRDVRVAGRDDDRVGGGERAQHSGAGRRPRSPRRSRASTSSSWRRLTNHSWNGNVPAGVAMCVRRRSSVAGRIRVCSPASRASSAVTSDSDAPARAAPSSARDEVRGRDHRAGTSPPRPSSQPTRAFQRLIRAPPAAFVVGEPGERVEDGCRGRARRAARAPRGRRRRCRRP